MVYALEKKNTEPMNLSFARPGIAKGRAKGRVGGQASPKAELRARAGPGIAKGGAEGLGNIQVSLQ